MKKSTPLILFMMILTSTAFSPVKVREDLVYVAVDQCRIVDTRAAGGAITANNFRNFRVCGTLGKLAELFRRPQHQSVALLSRRTVSF